MRLFIPAAEGELAAWLTERRARDPECEPMLVTGSEPRRLAEGLEPAPRDTVSLSGLADIEDFRPSDLTVTAGAGIRVEVLKRLVREQGLWLAAPGTEDSQSIGGWVAAAPVHCLEATFGPVRRQLLACTLVLHDGRITRWGRPVMKNVAGYDVPRLVCGSRGRLGVLTSVTLRLWPAPRHEWRARLSGDRAADPAEILAGAPDTDGIVWRERPDSDEFSIECLVCGGAAAVSSRREQIDRWVRSAGLRIEEIDPAVDAENHEAPARARRATDAAYRVSFGRSYLAAGLADLRGRLRSAGGEYTLTAYPHSGVVRVAASGLRPANRRRAPTWMTAVSGAGTAGRPRPDALTSGPSVRIERGGAEEHSAARRLRATTARTAEERVLEAFGGTDTPWQAEYL